MHPEDWPLYRDIVRESAHGTPSVFSIPRIQVPKRPMSELAEAVMKHERKRQNKISRENRYGRKRKA